MSSRKWKSFTAGEGLSSAMPAGRTPLRSVQNEMGLSTPSSRFKPRSLSTNDVLKTTKQSVLYDPDHHNSPSPDNITEVCSSKPAVDSVPAIGTADELDVTFKSFICSGVEVEISDLPSAVSQDTIILPHDQPTINHADADDAVTEDSMMSHSSDNHVEHPYFSNDKNSASVDDNVGPSSSSAYWNSDGLELSSTAGIDLFSGESAYIEEPVSGTCDITLQSFLCTGGEVELADYTVQVEETVPVVIDEVMNGSNQPSDYSVNSSILVTDHNLQSNDDHNDHPYCSSSTTRGLSPSQQPLLDCYDELNEGEQISVQLASGHIDSQEDVSSKPVICAEGDVEVPVFFGESACIEEPVSGTCDITLQSFLCTGGEVELADYTVQVEETVPVVIDEVMNGSNQPSDYSVNSSILVMDHNLQSNDDRNDHPYCSSSPTRGLSPSQQPLPDCYDELNEGEQISIQLASGHIDSQEDVSSKPVICAEGDVEVPVFSGESACIEEPVSGTCDITLQSFLCTGGEVEVADYTVQVEETVPVVIDEVMNSSNQPSDYSVNSSILVTEHNLQSNGDHNDHPYCSSSPTCGLSPSQEPLPDCYDELNEGEQISIKFASGHIDSQEDVSSKPVICAEGDVEVPHTADQTLGNNPLTGFTSPQVIMEQLPGNNSTCIDITVDHMQDHFEKLHCQVERDESVNNVNGNCPIQVTPKQHAVVNLPDNRETNCSEVRPPGSSTPSLVQESDLEHGIAMHSRGVALESSGANDCMLGLSGNGGKQSLENLCAENDSDVLTSLPDFPSVPHTLQFELMSPVIRGSPQARVRFTRDSALVPGLAEESAVEWENSVLCPSGPWPGPLESPMLRPLLNSTAIGRRVSIKLQMAPIKDVVTDTNEKPSVASAAQPEEDEPVVLDIPFIPNGPLQQQLRQMADFLIMASGKVAASTTAASAQAPSAPPESHSICVGTSPVKMVDHSLNTSGQFERKREFSMVDSCTITDPLLWNVPPGSLESQSKQELEQRLRSSMITVEALVQQLTSARLHSSAASTGPAPSDLRDQMVQTEHTELSQTTTYRDLYNTALSKIGELELDESSFQKLIQCIQDTRRTMTSLTSDTEAALVNMKHTGDVVKEDHESLVTQYGQLRSLCAKMKESQMRMIQKVRDTLQEREDMRQQMDEAFTAKDAAFSVMEQLREHSAKQISELEESLGSQKDLMAALTKTYPEQVALNKAYVESLNSASELLTRTTSDHTTLTEELQAARGLLQKSIPMLVKLNEKAAAALSERDQSLIERNQAEEAREQVQEELDQANLNLQEATQEIADLKLQVTIMTSEMGVLHEKLSEGEEKRAMLEKKVTDLNATVSSYMESFEFLEKGLDEHVTKLQKSWEDVKQANGRADELAASLSQSEQRVCELSQSLAHSEEQLRQLQAFSHTQSLQIEELKDVHSQLRMLKEEYEFMQMENQLTRDQVAETEASLRSHLQGLRERNIQCEDLKAALSHVQLDRDELQTELDTERSRTAAVQQELVGQLAQAGNTVTLLYHTLRGVTSELQAELHEKKPEHCKDEGPQSSATAERRHPPISFVDSIMKALTTEMATDTNMATSDMPDSPEVSEGLFSETSAFTRVPVTREEVKKQQEVEEEEQSNVVVLLANMENTVSELVSTLQQVKHHKDAQLLELHNNVCGLQGELNTQSSRHQAEVEELEEQLRRLQSQLEKGSVALQHKAKDEKMITKLCTEINETREFLNQFKTENTELRKEVTELRQSLQQSQVESCALREELKKASSLSVNPAHFMDEKIGLLQEVERLKTSLQEVEKSRAKLLDRAQRHQIIHQANDQRLMKELQLLDTMLDKVRKTLLSVPEVVDSCEPLKQLVKYVC